MLSAEAFAVEVKDGYIVKNAVKCAEECAVIVEVFAPERGTLVACKHDVVSVFFVVPSVNHVKEQPRVLLVELTINDKP